MDHVVASVGVNRNIKLTLAYDGSAYHGFQRQINAVTIQQILEERLAKLFGHPLKTVGAGRTDTGVHAYAQTVNFFTSGTIPTENIPRAALSVLPPDIVVTAAQQVPEGFHARRSAQSKVYVYRILQAKQPDPFQRNYSWHIRQQLDVAAMNAAVQAIVGTHDFSAFRAVGSTPVSPVRTIFDACYSTNGALIEFSVRGSGFLYHMVRNLVGTLLLVGQHRLTKQQFVEILQSCDRSRAGMTAPPQGLFLQKIYYDD